MGKKRLLLLGLLVGLMVFALGVASAGAEVVTWNPNDMSGIVTLSNGNLSANSISTGGVRATEGRSTGKWYWEITPTAGNSYHDIGIASIDHEISRYVGYDTSGSHSIGWMNYSGLDKIVFAQGTSVCRPTPVYQVGDIVGLALDLDNNRLYYYLNGTQVADVDLTVYSAGNKPYYPVVSGCLSSTNVSFTANFGATPFAYPIPDGYQAIGDSGQTIQAPTNLTATASNAQVGLSWTAVTGATSYKVKRSTTAGGPYTEIAANVTTTTYTDTTVTNGTTYYYVVTAVTSGSESGNSNEASATPQAGTTPPSGAGNALLRIIMMDSSEREYQLTMTEVNDFITWFESRASSKPYYLFNKTYNIGPFTSRKNYVAYDKIIDFEVMGY